MFQLEARVGAPEDISLRCCIAVRNLPLPKDGQSELENVKTALNEIDVSSFDAHEEVTKAVRVGYRIDSSGKLLNLGTVKVEMKNEQSKAVVMKNYCGCIA